METKTALRLHWADCAGGSTVGSVANLAELLQNLGFSHCYL